MDFRYYGPGEGSGNYPPRVDELCNKFEEESETGSFEISRNLATNPSFEASSGEVVLRRNLVPDPQAAFNPPANFRIASFNIYGGYGSGSYSWNNRRASVAEAIETCGAQIVALQEAHEDKRVLFEGEIRNEVEQLLYLMSSDWVWVEGDGGNHLLYKKNVFSVLSNNTLRMPHSRDVTLMAIKHAGGAQFWVANTHFIAGSQAKREDQADFIVDLLDGIDKVILIGDFNNYSSYSGGPRYKLNAAGHIALRLRSENVVNSDYSSHHSYTGQKTNGQWLDEIFTTTDIEVSGGGLRLDDFSSDHNLIYADLSVPPPLGSSASTTWTQDRSFGAGGSGVYSFESGETPVGSTFRRKTWATGTTSSANTGFVLRGNDSNPIPLSSVSHTAGSGYMRTNSTGKTVISRLQWYDSSGETITTLNGSPIPLPQDTWTRVTVSRETPIGAVSVRLFLDIDHGSSMWNPDDTLDATGATLEISPTVGEYFDGFTIASGDVSYYWEGDANSSPSVAVSQTVVGVSGVNALPLRSREWSVSGHYSARIETTSSTYFDSYGEINLLPLGLVEGRTYTISAVARTTEFHPYAPSSQKRSLFVAVGGGGGGTRRLAVSSSFPQEPGMYPVTVTFTVPEVSGDPVTHLRVRLYNGATLGGPSVWWDNLIITEGEEVPYFDGNSHSTGDEAYRWVGEPHASASVKLDPTATGVVDYGSGRSVQTGEWSMFGEKSIKIIYEGGPEFPEAELVHSTEENKLLPAGNYIFKAWCHIPEELLGEDSIISRTINVYVDGSPLISDQPENWPGTYEVVHFLTIPEGSSDISVRLGGSKNGIVYWDGFFVFRYDILET